MNICVYGAASDNIDSEYFRAAESLGEQIAARGHGLVFGGGATGLMGAVARGVTIGGGYILGIAPKFFDKPGVLYERCTEFIYPKDMRARKELLEGRSQATIVLPGGIGTYEEFIEILTLKSLGQIDRPVVLYNIKGYYDEMIRLLEHTADAGFMNENVIGMFNLCDDADEIIEYIEKYYD